MFYCYSLIVKLYLKVIKIHIRLTLVILKDVCPKSDQIFFERLREVAAWKRHRLSKL